MGKILALYIIVLMSALIIPAQEYDACELYGICEPEVLVANVTNINQTINQGTGNPFDQSLNTTDNVTHANLTLTGNLYTDADTLFEALLQVNNGNGNIVSNPGAASASSIFKDAGGTGGVLNFGGNTAAIGVSSDGTIGGYNYDGTYVFRQKGSNPSGIVEFLFMEENNDWRLAIPKSGADYALGNPRSMMIGYGSDKNASDVTCSHHFDHIDCDTGGSGGDLGVQDDIEFLGTIFGVNWSNVTITESQVTDLIHTVDTNETGRFENLTGTECSAGEFVFGVDGNGTVECLSETSPPAPQSLWETMADSWGVSVTASSSTDIFTFANGNGIRQDIVGTSVVTNLSGDYDGDFNISGELKSDSLNITGTYARIPRTRSPLTIAFNSTYNNTDERVLTVEISGRVTAYAAADEEMVYAEIYNGTDYINLTKDGIHYYDGAGAALGQVFAAHWEMDFEVLPGENYSIRYIHTNAVQVPLIDEAWGYY